MLSDVTDYHRITRKGACFVFLTCSREVWVTIQAISVIIVNENEN